MKTVWRLACSMLLICFATFIIAGCAKTPPKAEPVPPPAAQAKNEAKKIVVAKVNDSVLTMDQLVTMMNNLPEKSPGSPPETLEERKMRALDSLVLLELAYQRALTQGLYVDPKAVDMELFNYKQFLGGEKEYNELLATRKVTEDEIRAGLERDIMIKTIYSKEVVDKVVVPEDELKQYYEKYKQDLIKQEKVVVTDVFLLKDEGKASSKKAKELLKKIKATAGQDPWKLTLDGTFMVRNLTVRKEQDPELYEAAKKLKPQTLSGIIRATGNILHIIKLKEFSPERPYTFDEAKDTMRSKLMTPYQEKRTQEWEQELKKDAKIELMLNTAEHQEKEQKKP